MPTTPVASYRVQLGPDFGFADTRAILDDLAALGISHVYLSPVAEAVPGSSHGYDVVDHAMVRTELGGPGGLRELATDVEGRGMSLVIDIVPNHASVSVPRLNRAWWATLRDGPTCPEAERFDIDWASGRGRVVLAVLSESPAEAIENGDLRIDETGDEPVLRYDDLELPLAHGSATTDVAETLAAQHYVLHRWRDPDRNVRRFFTIDDLVAIRPEVPAVAAEVAAPLVELDRSGLLGGVRVDHVDGLVDPGAYLNDLRAAVGGAWILVEKILAPGEELDPDWAADGTTGYEHARLVDQLLVDPAGLERLRDHWTATTGDTLSWAEHEHLARIEVVNGDLAPDLARVGDCAVGAVSHHRPAAVRAALLELTVHLDRYRTYLPADASDVEVVLRAAERAANRRPLLAGVIDDLAQTICEPADTPSAELRDRWQQLTGPVAAKAAEDRAFYRHHPLVAMNEVGGDPGAPGLTPEQFHVAATRAQAAAPRSMLTSSTHDTKRSEDVRARLLTLSGMPGEWAETERGWDRRLGSVSERVSPEERSLAYQTVLGAWPIDGHRLGDFLVKAAREADVRTAWGDPDDDHEVALRRLAAALTDPDGIGADVAALADSLEPQARTVSLAQLVLRLTCPGVPDIYQGAEVAIRSLVDPDNRRPVDREGIRAVAAEAAALGGDGARLRGDLDLAKYVVIRRTLALRHRRPAAFGPGPEGEYVALATAGPRSANAVAFCRGGQVVSIVTRHPWAVTGGFAASTVSLPPGRWGDVLSDASPPFSGTVSLDRILGRLGVAVLESL